MLTEMNQTTRQAEIQYILSGLLTLPFEKLIEVRDYVQFLQHRYQQVTAIDHNDAWSEDDLRDLSQASLQYAAHAFVLTEASDV
jgi:hypothetical protein